MFEIILNKQEHDLAKYIGRGRQKAAEQKNYRNFNQCGANDEQLHINGACGELAFCKFFKIYPESCLDVFGDRGRYDAWLTDFGGIDVKTTSNMRGWLNVEFHKRKYPADYYALMMGRDNRYMYSGMISKKDLFTEKNLKDVGNGYFYSVHHSILEL